VREPISDHAATQYERPNQPWVCGLSEEGHACPAGPTARGRCPALAECVPIRDGDRWQCNRSALRGGPCDVGPNPDGGCGCVHVCRPVRNLRAMRGRFIAACAIAVLGALFIVLGSSWRDRIIRPGPLAQQHAQLLEPADGGAPNCRACHAAAAQNIAGWTTSLVMTRDDQPSQSQLCMNCHAKSIPTATFLTAHNLPVALLDRVTKSRGPQMAAATAASNQNSPAGSRDMACSACHREHHGAQVDLTAVDNVACQTCHQQRFQSFATDHPDFGAWPYERRTRIIFDHASHQGKHFAEKKQAFDCRTCHVKDGSGAVEKTVNYEKACASCHDEKIATSVGRGVPMLTLPTLDVDALKKVGHDIGAWPKGATGDFDGRLPPAMKLLLAGDPATAKAIEKLGAGFEFQDVDSTNTEQLAAVAELAKGIKALISDVSRRGPAVVRERLSATLERDVTTSEVATLTVGMSADTTRGLAGWLGLGLTADESPTQNASTPTLERLTAPFGPAGTWTRDEATFSVRYRPSVHADPVLASWLELLAKTPHLESQPVAAAMLKELRKVTAPGLCASCHSLEQGAYGSLTINWRAYDRSMEQRGFTKFSHGPHLVLPQLENCTSCHQIEAKVSTAASYANLNPQQFVSEFKPLTKQQCAACHAKTAAGDACQSCHNYHVESVEAWRLSAPSGEWAREAVRPFRISDFGRRIESTELQSENRNPQSAIP
jgi:hypothetical protein